MTEPTLSVIPDIQPAAFRDPVKLLRNMADEIERGDHGPVATVVVATLAPTTPLTHGEHIYPVQCFSGGRKCTFADTFMVLSAAHAKLLHVLVDGDGDK